MNPGRKMVVINSFQLGTVVISRSVSPDLCKERNG